MYVSNGDDYYSGVRNVLSERKTQVIMHDSTNSNVSFEVIKGSDGVYDKTSFGSPVFQIQNNGISTFLDTLYVDTCYLWNDGSGWTSNCSFGAGGGSSWVDTTAGAYNEGNIAINIKANPSVPLLVAGSGNTSSNPAVDVQNQAGNSTFRVESDGTVTVRDVLFVPSIQAALNIGGNYFAWDNTQSLLYHTTSNQIATSSYVGDRLLNNTSVEGWTRLFSNNFATAYYQNALVFETRPPLSGAASQSTKMIHFARYRGAGSALHSFHVANNVGDYTASDANLKLAITETGVGVNTPTPDASAALEVSSTTQGFLPPVMTTTQRDAISSPAAGLIIFNSTTSKHQGYDGSTWNDFY